MGKSSDDLWMIGTYWHLDTRPDELNVLKDKALKSAARLIDRRLRESPFRHLCMGMPSLLIFAFPRMVKRLRPLIFNMRAGGCLWDYAATACICTGFSDMDGSPLDLNRKDSTYIKHKGVVFATDAGIGRKILENNKNGCCPPEGGRV